MLLKDIAEAIFPEAPDPFLYAIGRSPLRFSLSGFKDVCTVLFHAALKGSLRELTADDGKFHRAIQSSVSCLSRSFDGDEEFS